MKKILSTLVLLALCQLSSFAAGLSLLYPTGGESLPVNGSHTFVWTNSASLYVQIYVDWYETNGTPLVTNNLIYGEVLAAGTNSFILFQPSRWPTQYLYKVRLDSTTNGLVSTSGYVRITPPATLVGTITNQSQWLPNQSRTISIVWSGLHTNEEYSLVLEAPVIEKQGYGFLITNKITGSMNGTQTFTIPYPSGATPAYPPNSYTLQDGTHHFALYNKRCDLITTFGSVDIVTAGLRMYMGQGVKDYILRGDSAISSKVFLDAVLATGNVQVTSIGIIFTSYATNLISMKSVLKDGAQALATNTLSFTPTNNGQYHTYVQFPVSLTVTAGQVKELSLDCEVLYTSGLGDFMWDTGLILTNVYGTVTATYVGGASISTKVISSYGTYVNILEVINPRFIGSGTQSNAMTFTVFCKPSTSYSVEVSTNLVSWSTLFTTNSVSDIMHLSIPMTNSKSFFRMKEN